MIKTLENQTIALAGLTQAVYLVQRIARTGSADAEELEASLASVLKLNPDDVLGVYDGLDKLRTGLRVLEKQLGAPDRVDTELARYAASLIFLERKLQQNPAMLEKIRAGVERATAQTAHFGLAHENVIAGLADIYQETISQLRPRVMVVGEPLHLNNTANANRIRALLLAGIRAAVLWRQCGGSRWKFLLHRRKMQAEAVRLLKSA
ncbi:high frequency lysogenization protein HflD [Methylococcus sp. EFPC2]|uniref:high frequency lysogenization protein HflD n=1 Tax=Methylococcus sp. EFPC2 TaxID=2812648 RepID=UPI0019683D6C|nr:high frequency lysogenization protein HflD [Methylococcus sp. EFPC2]QSA96874.1 high frequency lysogenization protein HflD [Methylococcus sp. EFPC2]